MRRTSFNVGIGIGIVFGYGFSLLIHCHIDLTAVAVAAVTATPIMIGQWLNYSLAKSNRSLIWNMHESNTQKLENIDQEVKKNVPNDKPTQT